MSKKNEIILKKNNNVIVTVEPPNAEMDLGKQINYFQEIVKQSASIGCTAAVINGVLLVKAQIQHPKSFVDWLTANTAVSQSCSYNYINAAKRTMGMQRVEELAQRGTMEIAENVQATMKKLRLESKPLTDLYCDVGIVKRTPSNMGGKRTGAGRKRKEELEASLKRQEEELGASAVVKAAEDFYTQTVIQGGLGNCTDEQIKSILPAMRQIVKTAEEIIKSRKSK